MAAASCRTGIMIERYNSFEGLIQRLLSMAPDGRVRVVSMDVFDTILHRRCWPDTVVRGVANALRQLLAERGVERVADPLQARHSAYAEVAAIKIAQGLDQDMTLDELCPVWVRHAAGPRLPDEDIAAVAVRLAAIEAEYEEWSCFANPPMIHACRVLKQRGFRLIYVSDMYLGRLVVDRLLAAHGFGGLFDAGYVSGDLALLKRTGRLFDKVLELEGLKPSEIIHLGDNPHSDGVQAASRGLTALVVRDRFWQRRSRRLHYDYQRLSIDRRWHGMIAAAFAQRPPGQLATFEEAFGQRVMGPVFTAFLHRVLERCRDLGIRRVFFMAREGFVLRQIFDELTPIVYKSGGAPQSVYLGVSRLTTMLASMQRYGLRELHMAMANTGHHSLHTLVAPLKMPADRLRAIARRHGIHDIDRPLPDHFLSWAPLQRTIEDPELQAHTIDLGSEARRRLTEYLEDLGFFDHSRVAVVDVGWGGQIQDSLFAALAHRPDRPQVFGIYLGLNGTAHTRKTTDNWMEWVVCDQAHLDWPARAAFDFVQGIEAIVRAPHGTVIGYRSADGEAGTRWLPVFRPPSDTARQAEMIDDGVLALFQAGIREFAWQYAKIALITGATADDTLPYARTMVDRLVRFPTASEARRLLELNNVSDLGLSHVLELGAGSTQGTLIYRLRRIRPLLRHSFWRAGVIGLLKARSLQLAWAVSQSLPTLPRVHCDPVPGIVWWAPREQDDLPQVIHTPVTHRAAAQPFEPAVEDAHQRLCDEERRRRSTGQCATWTSPLSLGEVLLSAATFHSVRLAAAAAGRQPPYASGMGLRGVAMRWVMGYPGVSRMLGALRRGR
jgi:FMN phosphatase YigB (HAD superfamily)